MAAFWATRQLNEDWQNRKREQMRGTGFCIVNRGLSKAEKKGFPWAIVMQDADGELLVPDVFLTPIDEINFVDFAVKELVANPCKPLDLARIMDLFSAVITKIYDYEYKSARDMKLLEVCTAGNSSSHDFDWHSVYRQLRWEFQLTRRLYKPPTG